MRDIKFRAWDKRGEKMYRHINSFGYDPLGKIYAFTNEHEGPLAEAEIMQFTGLQDKNGVDVFESDIVTAHYFYFNGNFDNDGDLMGEVIYSEWGSFCINNRKGQSFGFDDTSHFDEPCIEVIGNIYETPELLK